MCISRPSRHRLVMVRLKCLLRQIGAVLAQRLHQRLVSRSQAGWPVAIDCTAAVAAACPIMKAADCARIEPCTLVSLEWQRPATQRFSQPFGTRML